MKTLEQLTAGSNVKVLWQCKKSPDHQWVASVSDRVRGRGCPFCANKRACFDNCLATLYPDIAKRWHPTRNGNLTPYDFLPQSNKKVWWKCEKGHEWNSRVCQSQKGACPYCSCHKICKDNCLAVTNPELAEEWHPTKNGDLTPYDVAQKSGKKVWWKCEKKHEWQAVLRHRSNGTGCPFCNKKNVCKDNSFATLYPELAKEWHPTKNGNFTPEDVRFGTGKRAWWRCKNGHEWETLISNRRKGCGCPHCRKTVKLK